MATLIVQQWSTECGACGYGAGGWAASPILKDPDAVILTPSSKVCPSCGASFTSVHHPYGQPMKEE